MQPKIRTDVYLVLFDSSSLCVSCFKTGTNVDLWHSWWEMKIVETCGEGFAQSRSSSRELIRLIVSRNWWYMGGTGVLEFELGPKLTQVVNVLNWIAPLCWAETGVRKERTKFVRRYCHSISHFYVRTWLRSNWFAVKAAGRLNSARVCCKAMTPESMVV